MSLSELSENPVARRQTKADLEAALNLFSEPNRWTQGMAARKADGSFTAMIRGAEAASFCLIAGVERVTYGQKFLPDDYKACYARCRRACDFLESIIREETGQACVALTRWNDLPERTHAHVIGLLKNGIRRLESAAPAEPQA